jgi:hypothetical protein
LHRMRDLLLTLATLDEAVKRAPLLEDDFN